MILFLDNCDGSQAESFVQTQDMKYSTVERGAKKREITYKNSNVLKSTQIPLPPLKFFMATSFYLSFFQ